MYARILVPIDFSPASDAALEQARAFARMFGGALHLLHVTADRLVPPHLPGGRQDRQPAALEQLRACLTPEDRRRHSTVRLVERADPADAILGYARTAGIDLVIMGTHGRRGVAHLLLGSVAEKVVRSAPCPVLTVRETARTGARPFTRILVPTDFSGPSDAALDCARRLQLRVGASVHLLHVLQDEQIDGPFAADVFVAESPEARAARLKDALERLAHRVSAADRDAGRVTMEIIFGPPASTIVHYAEDNGFDAIVMGTHGRSGIAHLLMGSVAERVVRSAACPVITTHGERACVALAPERAAS